jgi:hypothetical protein
MQIVSMAAPGPDAESALAAIAVAIAKGSVRPQLAFVLYDADHDDALIHARLRQLLPDTRLIGGTSFNGFMTEAGVAPRGSLGLLLVEDATGSYGVAGAAKGADPTATAAHLVREALADAGCSGQIPEAVWIYQAPGAEEQVLAGVRSVMHDTCPVYGGSAADNEVAGRWRLLMKDGPLPDAIVVAVLFPSGTLGHAFQGGCAPTGQSGVVTQVLGEVGGTVGREIITIDDLPAGQVYNQWIGGELADELRTGGNILARTTLHPLAISIEQPGEAAHHLLIHPESFTADGHLRTFCNVARGERLFAMQGDAARLPDRTGRVVSHALRQLGEDQPLRGALLIYCAGCRLAVGERIDGVAAAVHEVLGDTPYLCAFTFGEQGSLGGGNRHGNLMISALAFGAD